MILVHNIYRLFALDLERYAHLSDEKIYEKFVAIQGKVSVNAKEIAVDMKICVELVSPLCYFNIRLSNRLVSALVTGYGTPSNVHVTLP